MVQLQRVARAPEGGAAPVCIIPAVECEAPQPPPADCIFPEVLNPETNQCEAPQPPPADQDVARST